MKIGFIGTGVMGSGMVKNLLKNGFEVSVYNRSAEKAKKLVECGATFCETIKECAKEKDFVITIVGYPSDVEECYEKIMPVASKDCILIDMTTSYPSLAKKLALKAKEYGLEMLDAPVSGLDVGANAGTLTIFVGGDEKAFQKATPVFMAMGKTLNYFGEAGYGQHAKMTNQIAVAANAAGAMEAMVYCISQGLDLQKTMSAISKGAAQSRQMDYFTDKLINQDFEPGFYIRHFIKDMKIAEDECARIGLELPVLKQVLSQYEKLASEGYSLYGSQALYYYYLNA